jgi:hypothetical protein
MARIPDAETGLDDFGARYEASTDIHQLRRTKHRLSVVKVLADCGELPDAAVFREWLQWRASLP